MGSRWQGKAFCGSLATLALALLVSGCGGGGSSEVSATATSTVAASGPTKAILGPVGDSGASGEVIYVKQPSGSPMMKVRLRGVDRTTGEAQYFIWQMGSRHSMTSFASYPVPHGNRLYVNFEPSSESLSWLEDGSKTQMLITEVKHPERFFASQAHWASAADPSEIGTPVARGTFSGPLVGSSGS